MRNLDHKLNLVDRNTNVSKNLTDIVMAKYDTHYEDTF